MSSLVSHLTQSSNWLRARRSLTILFAVTLLASNEPLAADSFTTLDYPGSVSSRANGVDGATIVGWQQPGSAPGASPSGYLYGGSFAPFQYPGGKFTNPRDASGSRIVGSYQDNVTALDASFIYDNGTWASLNNPSAASTYAESVDGNRVAGWLSTGPGLTTGFIYDGTWKTASYPGAGSTRFYGIDGPSVVGTYRDASSNTRGFIYDGTNWTKLDFPGSVSTEPRAISGKNIVGSYTDTNGTTHGFLNDGRFWTTLQVTGSTSSVINGVDSHTTVGEYVSGGVTHGFTTPLPTDMPQEFKMVLHGVVTSVDDVGNRLGGAFHVGDAVDGQYNYFDRLYQEATANGGSYMAYNYYLSLGAPNLTGADPSPVSMQLVTGGNTYESGRNNPATLDYTLDVVNDGDGTLPGITGDRYRFQGQLKIPDSFTNVATARLTTSFTLYDPTGNAMSSAAFPVSAPDVSKFASRTGRITLTDRFTSELLAKVEFSINSLAAVPEPSSSVALVIGTLLARTHRLRRKLATN